ncbi:MAG: monofunctional biosynthetic peptidoglycan transglycosylase [Acidobacteria bacterium]|nr:MAG: monofunctional biosynthetic peptidoglycan transglycosylase [Acidobacteriota bacterium]REK02084.1 MAG: monofunctional biosynthetic peptidoglycan transglycosylase [Acidobacteriota bacterium]REK15042.1 MAG: monofunctional biosynthetic peptidoglycan transglycosylase [Acidobacteriota bacterium]REK45756.1 MAG: monofunctional biosynthetic peptidoglycan transglycosylase [Acidobacteriota bacterium]
MWRFTKILFSILIGALVVWLAYEFLTFPSISKLRTENPETTSLIEYRLSEAESDGKKPKKEMIWQPISQISTNLQRAVIAGEDARFFEHEGFDWEAIQKAWDEAVKEGEKEAKEAGDYDPDSWIPPMPSFKRGASTITQQLAKNLYLSEDRNFLRKGREAAITYFMERELSKTRILELYLNVIEWGDGIYGAEAASRHFFKKSASNLSAAEAAYLAAMIPSPLNVFNPKKNPRRVRARQRILQKYLRSVRLPSDGTPRKRRR